MKKLLIKIPKEVYHELKVYGFDKESAIKGTVSIAQGKDLSEMTNGDVIKMMFPNAKTWEVTRDDVHCAYVEFKDICEIKSFPLSWWNAPYEQKEL